MSVLQLKNALINFGHPPILDHAELVIQPGERVCLVGRNGCGKSTLLKAIEGELILDDGQRIVSTDTRISRLQQDPPESVDCTIFDYVAEGLADVADVLKAFFHQTNLVATDHSDKQLAKLEQLQHQLDHLNAWQFEQRVQQVLTQLNLEPGAMLSSLSGGWRRKAALARAMACQPDILLLDEPTNHLDIEMIRWLENTIKDYKGAVVFVSHDRAFIRNVATRIIDLDRGQLTSYPGNYQEYLDKKAHNLEVEANQNAEFDKKLSQEETWIRQGIKARRTRNEGRVRALKALRMERSERRNVQGRARVNLNDAAQSGKVVFETQTMSYAIDGKAIVSDLTFSIQRGDKIALIGPNGCGKSTLIKLLLGQLEAQSGSVKQGVNIELAYFDQHRAQLDLDKKVVDIVADGKKEITINGRTKHVISYLQDYLFTPDRINAPVRSLSGGEKNRLLLAKLLARPSNLLILDEPTNDLDVETLELLEDTLGDYPGTVILVSHDREFVDNVVTNSLFFEGNGVVNEFVGGYEDILNWYQQRDQQKSEEKDKAKRETFVAKDSQTADVAAKAPSSQTKPKKLSYKYQLELDELPARIEQLEQTTQQLQQQVSDPAFFSQDQAVTAKVLAELAAVEQTLSKAYERWDELESMLEE